VSLTLFPPSRRDRSRSRSKSGGRKDSPRGRAPERGEDLRAKISERKEQRGGAEGSPRRSSRGEREEDGAGKAAEKDVRNERQAQIEELLKARGAGQYLPPHKLRMLQEAVTDKESEQYQRLTWDALKKSINGLINKVAQQANKTSAPLVETLALFCSTPPAAPLCRRHTALTNHRASLHTNAPSLASYNPTPTQSLP